MRSSAQILAENLRRLRGATGRTLTQEEIGAAAGIDQSTVGRILSARNNTQIDKLDALARVFAVRPHELLMPDFSLSGPLEIAPMSADAAELAVVYDRLPNSRRDLLRAIAADMEASAVAASKRAIELASVFDALPPAKQQLLFALADEMANHHVMGSAPEPSAAPTAERQPES